MYNVKTLYAKHRRVSAVGEIASADIRYNDMTVVLAGEMEYTVNGNKETLYAGDLVFIPCGKTRNRSAGDKPAEYISLNFTTDVPAELPEIIRGALTSEIMLQLSLIDELDKKFYPTAELMISPIIECIIMTLKRNLQNDTLPPLVRKIVEYVHSNLGERITLSDIGNHTFFSPIYCDSIFKEEMGRSIVDYIIEKRVEEAKKLILHDTMSLKRIAELVGFSDYNYFSRTFKKRSGYTPLEYKKRFTAPP